jgi:AcrR family transcriptional regulator
MGRRREFDLDRAIGIATDLFWRRGYEGTSVSELTEAIGITAPSFYFAFESKEALFRRIVETYQARQAEIVEAAFRQRDARSLAGTLLAGFADLLTDPSHARGCLIMNSAMPIVEEHPIRREWAGQRQALRLKLQQRFEQERDGGAGWPAGLDPDGLARMIVALIWGFAIEAQSGASRADLGKAISQTLTLLPVPDAGTR